MAEDSQEMETKFCKNCKRDISAVNFVMHEMHCMRNITLCKHCQEPVPKAEIDLHFEETHAKIACEKCGVQVEKSVLEKHEEDECSKRSMKCLYCELEMPKNELDNHLDYCGTRTEECVKCGQFIMKKDDLKHEESNCTYPIPKPSTDNTSSRNHANGGSSVLLPDQLYRTELGLDPFMFEEMNRILRSEDVLGAAGGPANPIVNDTRRERMKFTKSKTNKKSEVNKQRERTNQRSEPVIDPRSNPVKNSSQEEQDRLLAMHLSQDLNEEDNLQDIIRQLDKPSVVPRGGNSSNRLDRNVSDSYDIEPDHADISFLPCEFCGEAIPIDDLVNHQSNCTDDPLSSLMPQINNRDDPGWSSGRIAQETTPLQLDNRLRSQETTRHQPSVINNLDYGVTQNMWASDNTNEDIHGLIDLDGHGPDSDNFMLPCEFCDELFPQDVLVQHQAVCEPNSSMTPRVPSPAVQRPPKKQNNEPILHSDRYQTPPNLSDILRNSSRTSNSRTGSSASKDEPPSKHLRETLHKYGVDMKEPKIPGRRYSSTNDSDEENLTTPRRLGQPKRTDSAVRTRNTLETLLSPDQPSPAFDFLGHINGGKRKQSKDNINVSRQNHTTGYTPSSLSGARGDTKTSKPTGNSRNVRRDQDGFGFGVDTRTNRNNTRPTADITPSTSSRTRYQPSTTQPRTTALDSSGNSRRNRTAVFDNGINRNNKPPSRRHQDQL